MTCLWANKETITKMMLCSPRNLLVVLHVHHVQKMWSIFMVNKFSTCLGVNFHSVIHQKELPELVKDFQKCFQWSIQINYHGMMVSKSIKEVKRTLWLIIKMRKFQHTETVWWNQEEVAFRQMVRILLLALTNHIEMPWCRIQIDLEAPKLNKRDHLHGVRVRAERVTTNDEVMVVLEV